MMCLSTLKDTMCSPQVEKSAEVDRQDLARFQPTPEGKKRTVIVSSFFLVVSLFIGVPVWLKTTATYQAPLPFWDIKSLCSRPIQVTIPLTLMSLSDRLTDGDLAVISSDLTSSSNVNLRCGTPATRAQSKKLTVRCLVQIDAAESIDRDLVNQTLANSSSMSDVLSKVEKLLTSNIRHKTESHECQKSNCVTNISSMHTIVILPDSVHSLVQHSSSYSGTPLDLTLPVSVVRESMTGNWIHLILPPLNRKPLDQAQLTSYLAGLINSVLLNVGELQHLVSSESNETLTQPVPEGSIETALAQAINKQLPPSTAYDVTVTVLTNADEARGNQSELSQSSWNAQMLSDPTPWLTKYVQAAFHPWLPHVHVRFFSQRLHAVDVDHLVPSHMSSDRTYRYYTQDDLSTLINHLESYLGAPQAASAATRDLTGTKPGLHLILFIAMPETGASAIHCPQPLRFHLSSTWSPFAKTNVAVVPQWGGLFAVDAPSPCDSGVISQVWSNLLARQLVFVIRSLLGLPDRRPDYSNLILLQPAEDFGQVFHSQLDSWFLRRTIESMLSIRGTMTSLVDLLSRFPNMVINDHVADEVRRSTDVWARTFDALDKLGLVNQTTIDLATLFVSAQDALESVNSAFFDHSLLGRLYFQDDQKYGIYVPLFLPIGFGILRSTTIAFRILFPRDASPEVP